MRVQADDVAVQKCTKSTKYNVYEYITVYKICISKIKFVNYSNRIFTEKNVNMLMPCRITTPMK